MKFMSYHIYFFLIKSSAFDNMDLNTVTAVMHMNITFYYNKSKIQIFKVFSGTLDESIMMHSHTKNSYELHLIDDGRGVLHTVDNRYELSKNVLYVTGPNVLHKQTPDFEKPMHELCVYLRIPNLADNDELIRAFTSRTFWIGKSNAEIRRIFRQMVEADKGGTKWRESVFSSLALRLIVEMTGLYFPGNPISDISEQDTDLNENRSWILDQLFQEDCSSVTLGNFAERLGLSPRQAERIIKDYYGSSFKKLRYEAKMAMAATLLEKDDITVEECSVRCGYSSVTAFGTAFKQKYNVTPKTYQKSYKNAVNK